jgi:hypothetical protein
LPYVKRDSVGFYSNSDRPGSLIPGDRNTLLADNALALDRALLLDSVLDHPVVFVYHPVACASCVTVSVLNTIYFVDSRRRGSKPREPRLSIVESVAFTRGCVHDADVGIFIYLYTTISKVEKLLSLFILSAWIARREFDAVSFRVGCLTSGITHRVTTEYYCTSQC